ncbi:OLC1v1026412C1 [Oldenlandia corymbosa var. corymbosa]|uniref:Transcription repressor n=1 Tax=Oldenlandia corymbosa var. corymbosa TaxID=529605 RepID=A0AAV1C6Y2_OLDCO|nr:OLC1v1026412C1 [Oldenlandia corymbosa var. corymbosa]
MKLPSIFKNKETNPTLLRQLSSCKHPKTLSFRKEDEIFKTVNSVYFDPLDIGIGDTRESWFTNSSASASFSTEETEEDSVEEDSVLETIVRGARSDRLFFEPGFGTTSSILEEESTTPKSSCEMFPLKESVVLAMESEDPYLDFKRSMQEMVETNGLKDWESLEELLGWYLKMNGKMNHGFIVGAFVDLLLGLAASSSSEEEESSSFLSASSSFSSPSSSSSPLSSVDQKTD